MTASGREQAGCVWVTRSVPMALLRHAGGPCRNRSVSSVLKERAASECHFARGLQEFNKRWRLWVF
jgi:hypothetical protein